MLAVFISLLTALCSANTQSGIDVQDGSSIGLPEYIIYKVATDTDIGDSLDQATALCASARSGGKLLGNYPGTNTCGDRVFPPVSGGEMYLTTWAQTDGTDMQFGGNKAGVTVCGNDHEGNFIGRTFGWNKNWQCSNGVCNQKVACIAPKTSTGSSSAVSSSTCDTYTYVTDCTSRTYEDSVAYCADQGMVIASFHSDADVAQIGTEPTCSAYLGGESTGAGHEWIWRDGSSWTYTYSVNDGLDGLSSTRLVWKTDGLWHDHGHGSVGFGVICKSCSSTSSSSSSSSSTSSSSSSSSSTSSSSSSSSTSSSSSSSSTSSSSSSSSISSSSSSSSVVDCVTTDWAERGSCSVTCGEGLQEETRSVITHAANGGACCGALTRSLSCNLGECPQQSGDGSGLCSHTECTSAQGVWKFRTWNCPGNKPHVDCWLRNGPYDWKCCKATTTTTTLPAPPAEVVDCVTTEWANVGTCSETCGEGLQQQTRSVVTPEENGGACCGPLTRSIPCNYGDCPQTSEVVDCVTTPWEDIGSCSVTCGNGLQEQTRSVVTREANGGACCGDLLQTILCNLGACPPVDCQVSDWVNVGECTETCGGGDQTQTRTVQTPSAFGGAACPALSRKISCNTQTCPYWPTSYRRMEIGEPLADTCPCGSADCGEGWASDHEAAFACSANTHIGRMCKGIYRNLEWPYFSLMVECPGSSMRVRSRQWEHYKKSHAMPPVPAVGSGVCTVTGSHGNAKEGTPCTGYYYSGIEGRCTGTACCQGTGYGGHGWCGTGYPGQHGRWGACSPECDNAAGFDEASYDSDAARAAAIQELDMGATIAPTMSPAGLCGIPAEQPDSPIPTTLTDFNFFLYGHLSNIVSGMTGVSKPSGTAEQCLAECNALTPNPCQAFTYIPGVNNCYLYFHGSNAVADAASALTSNIDRYVDRLNEMGGHFVYTWVRCGNGYPLRIRTGQYYIPVSPVDCVLDLAATSATCTADCGTVQGVGSPAAANGGTECATYDCQPGDGACPAPATYAEVSEISQACDCYSATCNGFQGRPYPESYAVAQSTCSAAGDACRGYFQHHDGPIIMLFRCNSNRIVDTNALQIWEKTASSGSSGRRKL